MSGDRRKTRSSKKYKYLDDQAEDVDGNNDSEEDEDASDYMDDIGCEDVDLHVNKTDNALKDAQDADDPTLVYLFHQSQSSERSDASDAIDMDADLKFDSVWGNKPGELFVLNIFRLALSLCYISAVHSWQQYPPNEKNCPNEILRI